MLLCKVWAGEWQAGKKTATAVKSPAGEVQTKPGVDFQQAFPAVRSRHLHLRHGPKRVSALGGSSDVSNNNATAQTVKHKDRAGEVR